MIDSMWHKTIVCIFDAICIEIGRMTMSSCESLKCTISLVLNNERKEQSTFCIVLETTKNECSNGHLSYIPHMNFELDVVKLTCFSGYYV